MRKGSLDRHAPYVLAAFGRPPRNDEVDVSKPDTSNDGWARNLSWRTRMIARRLLGGPADAGRAGPRQRGKLAGSGSSPDSGERGPY